MRSISRSATALATIVAVVLGLAAPSLADPGLVADPTLLRIGNDEFPFQGIDPSECSVPLGDRVLDVEFDGDEDAGTWEVSGTFKSRFRIPNVNRLFQFDVTVLAGVGSYASPAPSPARTPHPTGAPAHSLTTSAPNHLVLRAHLYELDEPDCEKDDLICTLQTRLVSSFGQAHLANPPTITSGDWAQIWVDSDQPGGIRLMAVGGQCDVDISAYLVGQFIAIDPLTIEFP